MVRKVKFYPSIPKNGKGNCSVSGVDFPTTGDLLGYLFLP
jgi:hypothetical protein